MKTPQHKVKGFTITEVLVTLALTSVAITISYATLTYIQKLFYNYREQNRFLTEYTDFKKRMDLESLRSKTVEETQPNYFVIQGDSNRCELAFEEKVILMKYNGKCDTFHIAAREVKKEFESMKSPKWENRLLKKLEFETEFTKQKFNFYFYKNYDAAIKMALETKDQESGGH